MRTSSRTIGTDRTIPDSKSAKTQHSSNASSRHSAPKQRMNPAIYWTDPSSLTPREPFDDTNSDLPNTRPDPIPQILVSHAVQFACINISFRGKTARPKHIYSLYKETASAGYLSFYEMIQAASILYSEDQSKSRALKAAEASQPLNAELMASDSIAFIDNPMAFLSARQKRLASTTLNADFVNKECFNNYPNISRLRDLALGAQTVLDTHFTADPTHANTRPKMVEIQPVIDALAAVLQKRGEAIIVTLDSFHQAHHDHGLKCFLSEIHHVPKTDDPLGRLCFDFSNITNTSPVNSESVKESCKEIYGEIDLPTYAQILSMYSEVKTVFPNESIYIHKSDVSRAYHRILWSLQSSLIMSVRIGVNSVLIPLTVGFGPTLSPFAYNCVTKFSMYHHKQLVQSLNPAWPTMQKIYIDDTISLAPQRILRHIIPPSNDLVTSTLGSDSINLTKDLESTCETILGFLTNTMAETSSPSYRAYLKLIYVFFVLLLATVNTDTTSVM